MKRCPLCKSLFVGKCNDRYTCFSCGISGIDYDTVVTYLRTLTSVSHVSSIEISNGDMGVWMSYHTVKYLSSYIDKVPVKIKKKYVLLGDVSKVVLSDYQSVYEPDVTIAYLCRKSELKKVLESINNNYHKFDKFLIVVDNPKKDDETINSNGKSIRVCYRELNSDFGEQRNFANSKCETEWIFHIDSDEEINSESLYEKLSYVLPYCDEYGIDAIGLPRENYVNKTLSANYPDVRYVIIRKDVKWKNKVHETPEVEWKKTHVVINEPIKHYIDKSRLVKRKKIYNSISENAGETLGAELLKYEYSIDSDSKKKIK